MGNEINKYEIEFQNFIRQKIEDKNNKYLVSFCSKIDNLNLLSIFETIQKRSNQFFYFQKPEEHYSFLGVGNLYSASANGTNRTIATEKNFEGLSDVLINNWDDFGLKFVPLVLGGMKFSSNRKKSNWDDFADSDWFIPQYILFHVNNNNYIIHNTFYKLSDKKNIYSETDFIFNLIKDTVDKPLENADIQVTSTTEDNLIEKEQWIKKVNSALKEIDLNKYSKIVLSRNVTLTFKTEFSLAPLIQQLGNKYPRCYIFAFRKKDSIFFGASPEKLAKLSNGTIEADALAGSLPRGKTNKEDEDLEKQLLNSQKNLAEQNAVVDFIANSFSQFSSEIEYSNQPKIKKLPNIQHLWTPIKAKLTGKHSIFSILKNIHPTPAICGTPWSIALDSINETEEHDRGLFAGIIGWFNFNHQGDFAVAIRSALLKDNQVNAFAGCGIVLGSDPILEYEESKLKLMPILSLFKHETIGQP
jgi:menaquinone-specific isochorismate synthase